MPRARRSTATVAWAIVLLVLVACDTARAASPPSAALRGLRPADSEATPADQDEARRITDCARWNTLTPEQVAAFMRDGGRRLSCPLPVDSLPNEFKTISEKERQAMVDAARNEKVKQWENRKEPTPAQLQAQAQADTARKALEEAKAAAADAANKYKAMQAANNAASDADSAALQQQWKDVQAKQDSATSAQQSYDSATDALASANAAKQLDAQQAQFDAGMRDVITSQRTEWEKQLEADAKAHAAMLEELKATAAKRQKDLDQAEADRKQAELDQQLADEALRKQHEAERKQHEDERQQHEAEAAAQQKQFQLDEEARLQRERDAKATATKNEAAEAEMKKREEARATRDQEIADANAKTKEAETEFERKKAEQEATQKKYDELEKQRVQEENERLAAEAKVKADKDKADADAQKKDEDVPNEEKQKREDEEDCAPSPVGSPPKCENGGRCFQVKGKPEAQRCSCGKGYKGDKCEHKPCPPPAKEGNMVNDKCVKWESEYVCNGCNKIWDIKATCYEIDAKTSVKTSARKTNCKGLKEPENELYNRMCKFCLDGSDVMDAPGLIVTSVWEDGSDEVYAEDVEDESEDKEGNRTSATPRHRQLAASPAAGPSTTPAGDRYAFVPSFHVGQAAAPLFEVPAQAFVYSLYEHELVDGFAGNVRDLSDEQCVASCYQRMGSVGSPTNEMRGDHCSWLLWVPPYRNGNREVASECRIFNGGTFPESPQGARVLPGRRGTGMLAFLTYPRAYDMFRPSTSAPLSTRTFQVRGTTDTFVATFSRNARTFLGQGTYVTKNAAPLLRNCLVTASTRWEAGWLYQQRVPIVRRVYEHWIADLRSEYPHALPVNTPITMESTREHGEAWDYTFDALLRVASVQPHVDWITEDVIGGRGTDSPNPFQIRFSQIMRTQYFLTNYNFPKTHAGHLVAGSLKPPNWFFNYVPQGAASNSNGCWYYAEMAAKRLLWKGCEITYGVGLTYRTIARFDTERDCYNAFRPTKMSLDLRIVGGQGDCASLNAEWNERSLVTYTARLRQVETTRLMAHTLHRAVFPSTSPRAVHASDLTGFLHVATTLPAVDKCDTETGGIAFFASLKLTPEFSHAKLFMGGTCLTARDVGGHAVLDSIAGSECVLWTTGDTNGVGPPAELTTTTDRCITITRVADPTRPSLTLNVATLTAAASGGCLRFMYEFNPFTPPANPPAPQSYPFDGTVETTTPAAAMPYLVDALVTGLVGTVDPSGQLAHCLVYHTILHVFQLVSVTGPVGATLLPSCLRVQITQ